MLKFTTFLLVCGLSVGLAPLTLADEKPAPDAAGDVLMLDLTTTGNNPAKINFARLPRVEGQHAIISDVRDEGGKRVHQHAYLAFFGGRYWAMWSNGPGVPQAPADQHRNRVPGHDQADTRVSYATSNDGVHWSEVKELSGPPRREGFGWIARGFWKRDGQLLALASHFNAPDYRGEGLSLEAFRWDDAANKWVVHGTVKDDTLNNFPPKRLPDGSWMMSRRDHRQQLSVLIGGVKSFDDWQVRPLAKYAGRQQPEEPYWYTLPDEKTLVGLIRDNAGSKRLLRVTSTDNGHSWSKIARTNFPDAKSKFFALRTSRGYYALVSNSNPQGRDPLTLAISRDGLVYSHLFYLVGGRHIDYPHVIEQDEHLMVAFSGAKQTMEVLKISLDEIDRLIAADHTATEKAELPPVAKVDEGALMSAELIYAVADRPTPQCHASTIVETSSGLVAAWFGGTREKNPDVGIWLSRHDGKVWSKPVELVDGSEGEEQEFACWNPVLFQPKEGPLMLFYKVGLDPRQWWGMLMTSTDDGKTWSKPRRLGRDDALGDKNNHLAGPIKNKPIELADGTILCPSSTETEGWRVHFERSSDGGKTWQVIGPINDASRFNAIQPSVLTYEDGRMQILCRSREKKVATSWSTDGGKTWSPLSATSLPNPNSGTDAVTLADGRQLIVYNHTTRDGGFPSGRNMLNVALSNDGKAWQPVMTLERDRGEFSYPAVIQTADGKVHITYTWRRQSVKHVVVDPEKLSDKIGQGGAE